MAENTVPYHKKRKKGARRRFDIRKKHAQTGDNKENEPIPTYCAPTLPNHWQVVHPIDDGNTQYVKINTMNSDKMCQVSCSIAINQDCTWKVYFMGQKIPTSNAILSRFPQNITASTTLQALVLAVDTAFFCPGNPEEKYIGACKGRKGEKMSGDRGFGQTIGFIDDRNSHCKNPVTLYN